MAINLDRNLLDELGLGSLPDTEKTSLLNHIYETLEMRVGMRLADQMSNEQLDEFEKYFEAKDDAGAFRWLETNFPNYKEIVQDEFNKLKTEIKRSAPQILQASQQAPAVPASAPPSSQPMSPPMAPPAQGPTPYAQPPIAPSPYTPPPQAPAAPYPPPAAAPQPSPYQQPPAAAEPPSHQQPPQAA